MHKITLKIGRQTDRLVADGLRNAATEAEVEIVRWVVQFSAGGSASFDDHDFETVEEFKHALALDGYVIQQIVMEFQIESWKATARVDRRFDELRDSLIVNLEQVPDDTEAKVRMQAVRFMHAVESQLRGLSRDFSLIGVSDEVVHRFYDAREDVVVRLEGALAGLTQKIAGHAVQVRQQLDSEFQVYREKARDEIVAERNRLESDIADREKTLREEQLALDERLQQVNDRESRHVRRQIREDLKEELTRRSASFSLTPGTGRLRRPVFLFSVVLLVIFGAGLVGFSWLLVFSPPTTNAALVALSVRQIVFGLAFGATAVFFLRWNNRWFERHADEEFRLKRLHLDLDRASWVVEMAMEWAEEKGGALPPTLVDRLTNDLFVMGDSEGKSLHPADQVSAALFGAAARAHVELPGGTSLDLDRKSIKKLGKDMAE